MSGRSIDTLIRLADAAHRRDILDRLGQRDTDLLPDGSLPAIAGGAVQDPVAQPLGGATVSGTRITIDTYVNPPTRIPAIIRNLVAANQGYFAERIFNTPGFTVEGGAIIYEETFPEDYFVPEDQSIAPRAPGTEAARLAATRHAPKVARPESWAGSIEVTDEARRRNDVRGVQRQFTQAANTFADRIQTRAIETLQAFIEAAGRQIPGLPWRDPSVASTGLLNTDPKTLPGADFSGILTQFVTDKVGVRPDLLIINPLDLEVLDILYPGNLLQGLFDRYNLTVLSSVQVDEGKPIFVKEGAVGVMAFEKPLDQERIREGVRKTDVFVLESVPVFVADDASAVLQLTGVDDDGS